MAKALFGHVGLAPDQRILADVRRLQARVRELESELSRLRAANEALMSGIRVDDDLSALAHEPALT